MMTQHKAIAHSLERLDKGKVPWPFLDLPKLMRPPHLAGRAAVPVMAIGGT